MHVNLLPSSFVWQQLLRNRLRQWTLAFAVLPIVFIVSNASLFAQWWSDLREHQEMQLAAEPARKLQESRVEIAKATIALKQKIENLQALTKIDRSTSILGIVASSVESTDKKVQIQHLQVSVQPKMMEAKPTKTPANSSENSARPYGVNAIAVPENQITLTLKGIAIESESISKLVDAIQQSNAFPKIELRSTQERVVLDRAIQDFELECHGNE